MLINYLIPIVALFALNEVLNMQDHPLWIRIGSIYILLWVLYLKIIIVGSKIKNVIMKNSKKIELLRKQMYTSIMALNTNLDEEFLKTQSSRILISLTHPLYRDDWQRKYDNLLN